MPVKRKSPNTTESPSAKRLCPSYPDDDAAAMTSASANSYERPRNHPVYGQKSAFPGLETGLDDELFYGPAEDGMEYLRMVRSEANSMPTLFTAPKSSSADLNAQVHEAGGDDGEEGEYQEDDPIGTYADGAYIAPREPGANAGVTLQSSQLDEENLYPSAQISYYNLLRHRFLLLRSTLKCTPPFASVSGLDESHPISFPRHSAAAKKEWRRLLLAVDPQTAQLACMDMDSVLGVLGIMARLMSENFRSGDVERVRRIGAWAWGLLGKCREVGQLGTEEVGEIRDLGKRAVKILQKLKEDEESKWAIRDGESSSEDEEPTSDKGDPGNTADASGNPDVAAEELEEAKARLQARLQGGDQAAVTEADAPGASSIDTEGKLETQTEPKTSNLFRQTHAMLDMIITVVGEFYGQRDLLQERETWESD